MRFVERGTLVDLPHAQCCVLLKRMIIDSSEIPVHSENENEASTIYMRRQMVFSVPEVYW